MKDPNISLSPIYHQFPKNSVKCGKACLLVRDVKALSDTFPHPQFILFFTTEGPDPLSSLSLP